MSCSTVILTDGTRLAYNLFGSQHLGRAEPIVLVGGMSSISGDWERLSTALARNRPVLVFDHRGMGNSTYSNADRNDEITTESMARDLLFLIQSLGWKELAICGFSMGGVVTQELLLLPHHLSNPTVLPFRVTHALLTGTMATPIRDRQYGLPIPGLKSSPEASRLTREQKIELARPVAELTFDPIWVRDHKERMDVWASRLVTGRPLRTIVKQAISLRNMNFGDLHKKLSSDTQVLIIHGKLDAVVPFYSGEEILRLIPHARIVELGSHPGQISDYQFGHHWWEYFDVQVWQDVVDVFLSGKGDGAKARL